MRFDDLHHTLSVTTGHPRDCDAQKCIEFESEYVNNHVIGPAILPDWLLENIS